MTTGGSTTFVHPGARHWRATRGEDPRPFHRSLTGYHATPLVEAPTLAHDLGLGRLLIKDESSRLGLPAFKVLGASFAISRMLSERVGSAEALPLDELRIRLAEYPPVRLVTATDGNHGRAVARVARQLGISAMILHPFDVTTATVQAIRSEGAEVIGVDAPYDEVVANAAARASVDTVLIQDTSWEGYQRIPQWIVDGYGTLCAEIDDQLDEQGIPQLDLIVVPAGVGSLAQAVTTHYRSTAHTPAILVVEPESAAAVTSALDRDQPVRVATHHTVMTGLNCGTVSDLAWPILRAGVDAALTVTDHETITAVAQLSNSGVDAGPCGAATLAGLSSALEQASVIEALALPRDPTVVLINTESLSANPLPEGQPQT